jgi:flagellar hook-length control protein FliK
MDIAANAVLDAITPPTRQAPPRDAVAAPDDGPSFDDHLDAAAREETTPSEKPATPEQPREQQVASETSDPAEPLLGGEDAVVTPQAPTIAVFVQLIADATSPSQHSEAPQGATPNASQGATPSAPAQPAPVAPTSAAPVTQDAAAPASIDSAAMAEAKSDAPKNAAPAGSVTPTPQTLPATQVAPQTQTISATPAPAASPTVTPTADIAELPATAMAPAQVQAAPEHAARQPKVAAQSEAKPEEAAPDRPATSAPTAAPRTNTKAAAPQTASKDPAAFTSLLDAPEATPQQQTSSGAATAATPSTQTQHAVAEQGAARAAPAAHQVAREIVRKFNGGNTRFELRLDPPELGRVEVRLDVSRDHRVTAVIAADSPQALTELARHARDLEQMLQGAGLELSDNGLSFDLRQGSERAESAEFSGLGSDGVAHVEDAAPVAARPLGYERWRGVRVDMMV